MLIAHRLCVSRGDAPILRDLSLTIEPGALTALLGRNGAGKSTLLKAMAGEFHGLMHEKSARVRGDLTLNGEPLGAIDALRLARLRAVLPQSSQPAFPFSVEEVVLLGRYPHAQSQRMLPRGERDIVLRALELAGAAALAERDVTTLSGGELARVQFARVLAQLWPAAHDERGAREADPRAAPRYLLLDEPTAALDLAHQHHLLATVRQLTRDWHIGALAIVHDPNLAARHADRLALLADGTIVAQGVPREIMRAELIERCFGFAVRMLDTGADAPPVALPA
jgi:iron complex transport system ATP-binding protein